MEREIAGIRPEDIRVRILGTVIDKNADATRLVLDDGTGRIDVVSDTPLQGELNQMVRVFGRVIPLENGVELQGEITQDMSQLDLVLLEKLKSLKS
mgnify:CR=1 FL=1